MRVRERDRMNACRREHEDEFHRRLDDAQEFERVGGLEAGRQREVRARKPQGPIDLGYGGKYGCIREVSVEDGKIGREVEREFERGARAFGAGKLRQRRHAAAGLCCSSASIALTASPTVRTCRN